MKTMFDLSGKKAIVTGGGRGIGQGTALGLARQGADVTLWSRTRSELEETAAMIRDLGRQAWVQVVDVMDVPSVRKAADEARTAMGRIDILFNNAGVNVRQQALDVDEATYDKIMGINMRGAFFTAQAVGRIMCEQKGGVIINTSSASTQIAMPDRIVYAAAKNGVNHMTRVMALEWAPCNVRVNGVIPGFVETPMTAGILEQESFKTMFNAKSLLPRLVSTDEIAAAVVYIASDEAAMMTGQFICVDAGWTIH